MMNEDPVNNPNLRMQVGVCPQFDNALFEFSTVKENLECYGRIKGLTGHDL